MVANCSFIKIISAFIQLYLSVLLLVTPSASYLHKQFGLYACQGRTIPQQSCEHDTATYSIKSISVLTSGDQKDIESRNSSTCKFAQKCTRTIHNGADPGVSKEYRHLFNWLKNQCNGKKTCNPDGVMPHWWSITSGNSHCKANGTATTQYFASALIDVECRVNEPIVTVTAPPETTARTRPTTPTTTTPFPVFIPIYVPELIPRERIILGVAIGLAVAILIFLLIILYCCEAYRNHKRFAKLLRMLGAPQAQDDGFDDLEDYGKQDAWRDETDANFDALGEYTGVKPNEFMTLDKRAMENTGQILYDTQSGTMTIGGRGNSCSTINRHRGVSTHPTGVQDNAAYSGNVDFETEENLEIERRMAENLRNDTDYNEYSSYH